MNNHLKYRTFNIIIMLGILSFLSLGCSSNNDKILETAIIEQYSEYMYEWQSMALFYGYMDNVKMAEQYIKAFEPSSTRKLRIRITNHSQRDLEQITDIK
jgi:hypothetical protein